MYKSVYLKRGKEESLLRFHPWVFSGAIQRMDEGIGEGDLVRVLAENGGFIAVGHYQIGSIAVRVLSDWSSTVMGRRPSCRPIAWAFTFAARRLPTP